jgi:uncharacterized Zn finger protein (UPF0148 family)
MSKRRDDLLTEIKVGGREAPCPFCGIPRVRRSTYIRCCACGVNWIDGEALDKDPRSERQHKLNEEMAAMSTKGKKEESDGRR